MQTNQVQSRSKNLPRAPLVLIVGWANQRFTLSAQNFSRRKLVGLTPIGHIQVYGDRCSESCYAEFELARSAFKKRRTATIDQIASTRPNGQAP
jgi:hypothetical protein